MLLIGLLSLVSLLGMSQSIEKACFSVSGGFYEESPTLEIIPFYQQHHIRFTTNGNRPTAQSRLYTEPLLLDGSLYSTSDIYTINLTPDSALFDPGSIRHCIVIRAAVFDENDNCISEVSTNSYFIHALGCDTHGLPVVSLCADSLDLFDYEYGIFVPGAFFDASDPQGTGNYYQSGEAWERWANLEFYELNNEGINQQIGLRTHGGKGRRFQQKGMKIYAREIYGKKRFDHRFFAGIPQESFKHLVLKPFAASWNYTGVNDHICNLIASQLEVESLASRPVVLYLNGEYWGLYDLHERPDERYLEDHLGVDPSSVNLIKSWYGHLANGSSSNFEALFRWMEEHMDMDDQAFHEAETMIDMDCFIDYNILELFIENKDWPANNMRCWQLGSGRWRWIFYDGDAALRWMTFRVFENIVYEGNDLWPSSQQATVFFRALFSNNLFKQRFLFRFQELLNTVFRYENTGPMFEEIQSTLAPEIPFQSERFGYPENVEAWNTDMGHTRWFLMHRCDSIVPVLDTFMHWTALEESQMALHVFPNPSSGTIYLSVDRDTTGDAILQVFDVLGRQLEERKIFLEAGPNFLSFDLSLAPGHYFLKIDQKVIKIVKQ